MRSRHSHRHGSAAGHQHRSSGGESGQPKTDLPEVGLPETDRVSESLAELFLTWGGRLAQMTGPLEVELSAASLLSQPRQAGLDQQLSDVAVVSVLASEVAEDPCEEAAAVLRAIVAVGTRPQRSAATYALGTITASGFYPPQWAQAIGRPHPVAAWRRYDVFGDTETIAVTFAYGPDRHTLLVATDLFRPPTATFIAIDDNPTTDLGSLRDSTDPLFRSEDLDLATARAHLEPALARCGGSRRANLSEGTLACLPVATARMRRLPQPGADEPEVLYGADDRQSAVTAFLATPAAHEAAEPDTVRFWAELLAGYSSLVPGTPPTRVGPLRLAHILLSYLPTMVELTPAQRQGLPAAVGAWARWAAAAEGLDTVASDHLATQLPAALARFDAAYDDADNAQHRAYLRDVPATITDASARAAILARRAIAVPTPDARTGDSATRTIDVAVPAERRALIRDEYGECSPPAGMPQAAFLDTVERISERLWHDDPPRTWQTARRLLAHGVGQHEILHQLAETAD